MHYLLAMVHACVHHSVMAPIPKRLEQRYVVEGDELAADALKAIQELRAALAGLVLDSVKGLKAARTALAKHR